METKDLTCENWLTGKFELDTVYRINPKAQKDRSELKIFSTSSLNNDELDLINQEQLKLFESLVKETTKSLIDDFNTRYLSSESPKTTLFIEADRVVAFLRGNRVALYPEGSTHKDLAIEKIGELVSPKYNLNLEKYVNQLLRGIEPKPHFVPGPHSPYYEHKSNVLPQVYAKSLINLYTHLSKFDNSIDPKRLFTDPYQSLFHDEPHNSFPDIFSSGYVYLLFLQLEEVIILPDEDPKSGDYNLIYKILDHPLITGFLKGVSFFDFINFINRKNNTYLNFKSNKPAHHKLKKNIIRFFLREFFYHTKTIDVDEINDLVYKVIEQKATY